MNYFELFDIPVSFLPDQNKLKQQFYVLSRKYHPDFFTQENEADQAQALELSSLVNKAYKTLSNPDNTIEYVLQIKGQLEDDEKYKLAPDFLMDVMELNEQLTDAKLGQDEAAVAKTKKEIEALKKQVYAPVESIITSYAENNSSEKDLLQVKDFYFKKKYLDRILAVI